MRFYNPKQRCYLVGEGSFSGKFGYLPENFESVDASLGIAQSIVESARRKSPIPTLSPSMSPIPQRIEVKADVEADYCYTHGTDEHSLFFAANHSKAHKREAFLASRSQFSIEVVEDSVSLPALPSNASLPEPLPTLPSIERVENKEPLPTSPSIERVVNKVPLPTLPSIEVEESDDISLHFNSPPPNESMDADTVALHRIARYSGTPISSRNQELEMSGDEVVSGDGKTGSLFLFLSDPSMITWLPFNNYLVSAFLVVY